MAIDTIYGPKAQTSLSGANIARSIRQVRVMGADSQGAISIMFRAPDAGGGSGEALSIVGASFGLRVGGLEGSGADTEDTPIPLTFEGNPGFYNRNGEVWSDYVAHPGMSIVNGSVLVVIFDILDPNGNTQKMRFRYGTSNDQNTCEIFNGQQTRAMASPTSSGATLDDAGSYNMAVPQVNSSPVPFIRQRFIPSSDNAVHGHKDLNDGTDTAISNEYAMPDAQPTRIVFAFFFLDGGTIIDASDPVFRIDGGSDIPANMVGAQAGGGNYIAWVEAPTGDLVEFQCTREVGYSIYFEFMFFGYGMSTTQFDVGGDAAAGSSVTIDRAEVGTTIGWMLANSETGWGGTSPTLVQQAERVIFGSNRQIEVGLTMEDAAATGSTVSYSTAQRVLALTLESLSGDVEPPEDSELSGTGLSRVEFGSPGGVRTNGMLHPIDSGV